MRKRSRNLQSTKSLKKKRKKLYLLTTLYFIIFVSVFSSIILFNRLSALQIKNVNAYGEGGKSYPAIEEKVNSILNQKYIGLVPYTNKFFYPKKKIANEIVSNFPVVNKASLKIEKGGVLKILVDERKPKLVICPGPPAEVEEEEGTDFCFFGDEKGLAYDRAPKFSLGVYDTFFVNTSTSTVSIGKYFTSTEKFDELEKFLRKIKFYGIQVNGILISDDGLYELYIKNKNGTPAVVYFDDRMGLDKVSTNFILFWQNESTKNGYATSSKSFDYINMRFGNNIFFKNR